MAGISLAALDDAIRKEIEPFTSPVDKRLEALQQMKAAGIKTYLFMGSIMPWLTDWQAIIERAKGFTDLFIFENLNMHGSITNDVLTWIAKFHPELKSNYQSLIKNYQNYWDALEKEIINFRTNSKIKYKILFHHSSKSKQSIIQNLTQPEPKKKIRQKKQD